MAGKPQHDEATIRVWHTWYMADLDRSILDTSLEFGVSTNAVRDGFKRHGLERKGRYDNRATKKKNTPTTDPREPVSAYEPPQGSIRQTRLSTQRRVRKGWGLR